jgi:hypothetical protein
MGLRGMPARGRRCAVDALRKDGEMTLDPQFDVTISNECENVYGPHGFAGIRPRYGEPSFSITLKGSQLPASIYGPLANAIAKAHDQIHARRILPSSGGGDTRGGMPGQKETNAAADPEGFNQDNRPPRPTVADTLAPPPVSSVTERIRAKQAELDALRSEASAELAILEKRVHELREFLGIEEPVRPASTQGVTKIPPPSTNLQEYAARALLRPTRFQAKLKKARVTLADRVLKHIEEHPKCKSAQIAEAVGLDVGRISSTCNVLKRAKKIRMHGKGRSVTWTAA